MIGIIKTVIGKFKMKKERENMKKPENRKELEEALRRFLKLTKCCRQSGHPIRKA